MYNHLKKEMTLEKISKHKGTETLRPLFASTLFQIHAHYTADTAATNQNG